MEERIKAIIRSSGWNDHTVEPFEAETFSQKVSSENFMWQTIKNGGSLFIKKVEGEVASGTVNIISENPHRVEPQMTPYAYTIVIGVGRSVFGNMFNVFLERRMYGEDGRFEVIYSSEGLEYVNKNIEKILSEVVKPDFYYDKTTTERRSNNGQIASHTKITYPTIESGNETH